jgi:GAF domain-containing protein
MGGPFPAIGNQPLGRLGGCLLSSELEADLIHTLELTTSHLLFLSKASHVLKGSLTDSECFSKLLALVVPAIADWASIHVLTNGQNIKRVNLVHVDPKKEKELKILAKQFQPNLKDLLGPGRVLKTGMAEHFPHLSHAQLLQIIRNPELVRKIEHLGITSAISVPLKAHGEIVGVLWLATTESKKVLSDDDFKLAQEIANRAAYSAYDLIRYQKTRTRLAKLQIEMSLNEKHLASIRHDILTALTSAMPLVQLMDRKSGGTNNLAKRVVTILDRIAELIRSSGDSIPLQEAA